MLKLGRLEHSCSSQFSGGLPMIAELDCVFPLAQPVSKLTSERSTMGTILGKVRSADERYFLTRLYAPKSPVDGLPVCLASGDKQ